MKRKSSTCTLAVLATIYSSLGYSATVVGPGDYTVGPGSTPEKWELTKGANLTILPGGEVIELNLSESSSVSADGALMTGRTVINNSNGSFTNSRFANATGVALQAAFEYSSSASPSVLNIINSSIQGLGRGATLVGQSDVTFSGSSVVATAGGGYTGNAIEHYGGNLYVTNRSVLSGADNGLKIMVDQFDGTGADPSRQASTLIDNSIVTGITGNAIEVTRNSFGDNSIANIVVRNGSELNGGNGNILWVHDNSTAAMTVENSSLTGNVVNEAGSTTNLQLISGSSLTGSVSNVTSLNVDNSSLWNITSDSSVSELKNGGTLAFSQGSAGRTLLVNGDYEGDGGTIVFNSVLGGDDSLTDKLVIKGSTSGNTFVRVNNLGGSGLSTLNGIELIEVNGLSSGNFSQQGRIVAGAYDYRLEKKEGNWYLTSSQIVPPGPGPNPDPGPDPDPNPGPNPEPNPGTQEFTLRPEGGAYNANLAATQLMFAHSLSDRKGSYYSDAQGQQHYTSLWIHSSGGHNRAHDTTGQLSTHSNRFATLIGGNLYQTGNGHIGVLAGYGNSRSNTNSRLTGYRSRGQVDGYTAGLYGTWFAEGTDEKGLWVDSVLQYSWFRNTVSGEDVSTEIYRVNGLSVSLESGYVFPLFTGVRTTAFLQPQAKIMWSDVGAADYKERNGTLIQTQGNNGVRSSIGLKLFIKGHAAVDDSTGRFFKPYIETNWIHNTERNSVSMDGVTVTEGGTKNIMEVKTGLEVLLSNTLSVTGGIGQQFGSDSWTDTSAALGIRYKF